LNPALARLGPPAVLICDELGYIYSTGRGESFLSSRIAPVRARRSDPDFQSPFGCWGMIFGDTTAAAAIMDRLIDHAEIIALKGNSFRTRGKEQAIPSTAHPRKKPIELNVFLVSSGSSRAPSA
jgi:DNA replication protein DnaC